MQTLLAVLLRYYGFLMFLALEIVAFVMIISNNREQNAIYFGTVNEVTARVDEQLSSVTGYYNLPEVADSLARSNARLRRALDLSRFEEVPELDTALVLQDSTRSLLPISYIPARIVSNSTDRHNNYITLDKGSRHGVQPHTGVVSDDGLVGIITQVSTNYSKGYSLLHRQARVSVAVKRNNYFGSLVWRDNDPRYMHLEDIPKHARLIEGDTIVTSGYSYLFPPRLMVGVVDTFYVKDGSNFYDVTVRLHNDLSRTQYAYILQNDARAELEALDEKVNQ